MSKTAIVIGAGIAGLATARALAIRNYDVTVLERNERAIGASIRNFGMIWPIGQPDGRLYERAMLTRSVWTDICKETGLWYDPVGSLHLAYSNEEWNVLEELSDIFRDRGYRLLAPGETVQRSSAVVQQGLKGSLFSPHELIVDPRQAIPVIADWLNEKFGVQFIWGKTVTDISYPSVYAAREEFEADEIYVCSGADFETLYPEKFAALPVTKCKLQMMRMAAQPDNWRMGPALCGGLSLLHYNSFRSASSLRVLRKKLEQEYPHHLEWGIHVMAAQNQQGELTIGDSHEYGSTHDPFDRCFINKMILEYLQQFARFRNESVIQAWNGIYSKLTDGRAELVHEAEPGVSIINCFGGAGMTLGFGLCEQIIGNNSKQLI